MIPIQSFMGDNGNTIKRKMFFRNMHDEIMYYMVFRAMLKMLLRQITRKIGEMCVKQKE